MTKKAFSLGKTILEEFSKEQLKSAVKNIGKQVVKPATILHVPRPLETHVHFSPPKYKHSEVHAPKKSVIYSPNPTTQKRNTRTFKARQRIPESGVLADLVEKSGVKRTLFE